MQKQCVPDENRFVTLTKRQKEVLELIFAGHSSQETARMLFVSRRTIDNYLSCIYEKLHVSNRVQAYRRLKKLGLWPED